MEIRVKEQPKELENRAKWPHGKKKEKGEIEKSEIGRSKYFLGLGGN